MAEQVSVVVLEQVQLLVWEEEPELEEGLEQLLVWEEEPVLELELVLEQVQGRLLVKEVLEPILVQFPHVFLNTSVIV